MKEDVISISKIICFYRYLSWALTSIAYLTIKPYSVLHYKIGTIAALLVISMLINNLYVKSQDSKSYIKKLVLIETIGIEFLLLPTGGLLSPFIWYALNPILVSAIYLSAYFSWINLIFYLLTGSLMTFVLFNAESINIIQIILENFNLILAFVLINFAVRILSILTKELKESNIMKEESIGHIMSLYQMIEALNNHSSKEKLFEVLIKYTEKITGSKLAVFWLKENNSLYSNAVLSEKCKEIILSSFNNQPDKNEKQIIAIEGYDFICLPIVSTSTYYGIAAVQLKAQEICNNIRLLKFVSELCSVILERFEQEGVEEQLLVMEEQNRIADEMHDNVSQRLFSISYGIHGILGRLDKLTREETEEYLSEICKSSDLAMKELRCSIYRLSSRKNGKKYLQNTIGVFLDSISKLQNITIDFTVLGNECVLSIELKKGLIRIIREACGNAVRHGLCSSLLIKLTINSNNVILFIADDGKGFVVDEKVYERGLGLSNIKNIVKSFNGETEIISSTGEGTKLSIIMPVCLNKEKGSLAI